MAVLPRLAVLQRIVSHAAKNLPSDRNRREWHRQTTIPLAGQALGPRVQWAPQVPVACNRMPGLGSVRHCGPVLLMAPVPTAAAWQSALAQRGHLLNRETQHLAGRRRSTRAGPHCLLTAN